MPTHEALTVNSVIFNPVVLIYEQQSLFICMSHARSCTLTRLRTDVLLASIIVCKCRKICTLAPVMNGRTRYAISGRPGGEALMHQEANAESRTSF